MNTDAYKNKKTLDHYKSKSIIYEGEKKFKEFLEKENRRIDFLDIGVGGGRTAEFFAPICKKYNGIDVVPEMIDLCKSKYEAIDNMKFYTMDATNLSEFADESFDAVLFSYNGIDCVNMDQRTQVLNEIMRVLKKGGHFCFSFHNIVHVKNLYGFQKVAGLKQLLLEMYRFVFIRIKNGNYKKFIGNSFKSIYDGDIWFTIKYVYSNPSYQVEQIKKMNFSMNDVHCLQNGLSIESLEMNNTLDACPWINVICSKPL